MPTTAFINEARDWLKTQGYSVEIIHRPSERAQWYRADGKPLPNLLPVDAYHIQLFRAKGWTLKPPAPIKKEALWEEVQKLLRDGPKTVRELSNAIGEHVFRVRGALLKHLGKECVAIPPVAGTKGGAKWMLKETTV